MIFSLNTKEWDINKEGVTMFEKEAEEYTNNFLCDVNCTLGNPRARQINSIDVQDAFKDGAEFAYKKANEWHYVKDGDLPKKTGEYLVYIINGYGSKSIELIQYNSGRHFWCVDCQNDVIAWKEIILPKESE